MNPGLVTTQSLPLAYHHWIELSLEMSQQFLASPLVSEEIGTVEENLLNMAVGQRHQRQPAREIFFVKGMWAGSLSRDKRREEFIKDRKKMTTTVAALGDETPGRANYSIAYLRHFHVTKQSLCLKTNLKHRLELRQPIRERTQAGWRVRCCSSSWGLRDSPQQLVFDTSEDSGWWYGQVCWLKRLACGPSSLNLTSWAWGRTWRMILLFGLQDLYLARGILVPWPGIEPSSPALQGRFWTTGSPGKSPSF